MALLGWLVIGFAVGLLARIVVPTGRTYGCLGTILLGIVGSIVGGTFASVLAGDGFEVQPAGFIGSVVGAIAVLVLIRSRGK